MNQRVSNKYLQAFNKGDDRRAIRFARRHLEMHPADLQANGVLASALLRQQQFSDAMPVFDLVLETQPDNLPMQLGRISCWLAVGRVDMAIQQLQFLLQQFGQQPALWDALGQAFVQAGQYPEAYRAF